MNKTPTERLAHLLEVEKTALLTGDFDTINAIMPEKEALAAEFDSANAADLSALSSALIRNGTLLAAAKDGVSAVLTTLQNQRNARMSLSSYDSKGNATTIAQPERGTERRF